MKNYRKPSNLVVKARNPLCRTPQEIERDLSRCAGFVKMTCGPANNCAYIIMMDCLDQLRRHPRYDRRIRKLFEGKPWGVTEVYRAYRNRLRWPGYNDVHYFDMNDMPEEARKKYGIISEEKYFEFWEGTGSLLYNKSRQLVTSLWNKYRLSMMSHNVPDAGISAWGLVGVSVLELSVETWRRLVRSVKDAVPELPQSFYEQIYQPFSLQPVSAAWQKAFFALCPESSGYDLGSTEERNIAMGLQQLRDLWISPEMPYDSAIRAIEDFSDEIFRSKGEAKKATCELAELRDKTLKELEEERIKDLQKKSHS